jgi:hypothetical protein
LERLGSALELKKKLRVYQIKPPMSIEERGLPTRQFHNHFINQRVNLNPPQWLNI